MSAAPVLRDHFGRPLGTLRLSVTDRCNLRCEYCMPEREYVWLPREDLLTFEELERLTGHFLAAGARRHAHGARRSSGWRTASAHPVSFLPDLILRSPTGLHR